LIYALGYSGFPEFKDALRATIEQTTPVINEMSRYELGKKKYKFPQDSCKAIFELEMKITQETLAGIDIEEHQRAVDLIYSAPMIIVLGCGANSCCSQALGFALQVILKNVHIVENLGLEEGALLRDVPDGTVCIAFFDFRDISRVTQEILEILKGKKHKNHWLL
jgi:DNA-binding MurR/RpiR family transcriptional regulator